MCGGVVVVGFVRVRFDFKWTNALRGSWVFGKVSGGEDFVLLPT